MNLGKITLITPPDKLFNSNISYLLVKPSNTVKAQFQEILSRSPDDLNVFIFDDPDTDISWLLSIFLIDILLVDQIQTTQERRVRLEHLGMYIHHYRQVQILRLSMN